MAVVSSCCEVSCYEMRSISYRNASFRSESGNERDLCSQLPAHFEGAHCEDCSGNGEEGAGYGRSVCPECPGLHARNNGRDNGMQPRKGKLNL